VRDLRVAVVESAVEIVAGARIAPTTIALFAAILLALEGNAVDVIAFPAKSVAVPTVKLETVKSELESPA
jgi:hypothetical protein